MARPPVRGLAARVISGSFGVGFHHDFRVIVEELPLPDDSEDGDRMDLPVEESLGD